eukprot:126687-Pleurochrysis_carterae.AAC.1
MSQQRAKKVVIELSAVFAFPSAQLISQARLTRLHLLRAPPRKIRPAKFCALRNSRPRIPSTCPRALSSPGLL